MYVISMYEKGNMYVNAYVRKQFVSASRRCTVWSIPLEEVLLEESSRGLLKDSSYGEGCMYKVAEGMGGEGFGLSPESFGDAGIMETEGPLTPSCH